MSGARRAEQAAAAARTPIRHYGGAIRERATR
jgi:hypothetical protein